MKHINYSTPAELYLRSTVAGGKRMVYKRFASAAEAVQFAVESGERFATVTLENGDGRLEKADIRRLYDADQYPLSRKFPVAA